MNIELYEILKKYPDLHIEILFNSYLMCYIIKLTYGIYYKKYYKTYDDLIYSKNTILTLIQDFFIKIGVNGK